MKYTHLDSNVGIMNLMSLCQWT